MEMVIPIMEDLRNDADKLENLMDANLAIPTWRFTIWAYLGNSC